jgi:hypothetical protein
MRELQRPYSLRLGCSLLKMIGGTLGMGDWDLPLGQLVATTERNPPAIRRKS